ncbi:chemotaxis protein CheW [Halomonas sp. CH40]
MAAIPQQDASSAEDALVQVVSFALGDELFALPMSQVLEIMRYQTPVEVPLTPPSLLGLAGLRGSVSPIIDLRALLGMGRTEIDDASRVLLLDMGQSVGMVVDHVDRVLTLDSQRIEAAADIGSVDTELLTGIYRLEGEQQSLLQLLDLEALMAREFSGDDSSVAGALASVGSAANQALAANGESEELTQLVSIEVDGQEYAFRLGDVQEVLRYPEQISHTPKAPPHVLGLMSRRGKTFPLFSLRTLLALAQIEVASDQVVVVLRRGSVRLALAVDQVKEVVRLEEKRLEPVPEVLARDPDMQDVAAICRLDEGQRLLSLLATDPLFADAGALALDNRQDPSNSHQEQDVMSEESAVDEISDECQLVVFTLNDQQYGISIEQVQEITRLPERFYHVPKSPDFIEGMINLRGSVLPVVDMRARFGLSRITNNERQRILVLNLDGVTTGFVVDTVSEVRRLQRHTIEPAPRLSAAQQRLLGEVVRTPDNQLIQLLNIDALMSHDEQQALLDSADAGDNADISGAST